MNRLKLEKVGFWLVFITIGTLLQILWEIQVQKNNEYESSTRQFYKHLDNLDSAKYYLNVTLQFRQENNLDTSNRFVSKELESEGVNRDLSEFIYETKKESRAKKMNIKRLQFLTVVIGFIAYGFLRKNWNKRSKV